MTPLARPRKSHFSVLCYSARRLETRKLQWVETFVLPMYTYQYVNESRDINKRIYIYIYIYLCSHIYIYKYAYIYINMSIYIYISACAY